MYICVCLCCIFISISMCVHEEQVHLAGIVAPTGEVARVARHRGQLVLDRHLNGPPQMAVPRRALRGEARPQHRREGGEGEGGRAVEEGQGRGKAEV